MALRVDRKGYRRSGYYRKDGTRVSSASVPHSSFTIKDRGSKGRGPQVIPPLKKGTLGVDFSQSTAARRKIEIAQAKRHGERHVQGQLQAVSTFTKRTSPEVSRKAASDRHFIAGAFRGRQRVKSGTGFGRSKK